MDWKNRFDTVYRTTLKRPYVFSFFIIIILYLAINIFVNDTFITAPLLFSNYPIFSLFFILFGVLVAALVAANINLMYVKIRALERLGKGSGLTALGAFGGLLGGACPACFVGLLPASLGLVGVAVSLGDLPLYGLEIQIVSAIVLGVSLFLLTSANTCSIKK